MRNLGGVVLVGFNVNIGDRHRGVGSLFELTESSFRVHVYAHSVGGQVYAEPSFI